MNDLEQLLNEIIQKGKDTFQDYKTEKVDNKSIRISIRITERENNQLIFICEQLGISKSQFCRQLMFRKYKLPQTNKETLIVKKELANINFKLKRLTNLIKVKDPRLNQEIWNTIEVIRNLNNKVK